MDIKGKTVDQETRCVHYHSSLDIIAIKFKCCNTYYPCFFCHEEEAGHRPQVWSKSEIYTKAILCGVCKHEMTVEEYKACKYECPSCKEPFNPGCKNHDHLYFER